MDYDPPKKEKNPQVFEKKPKDSPKTKAKPKKEDEPLFQEVKGKIKEGNLRKTLKVADSYKFTKPTLNRLLKHEEGKEFDFQGKKFKMTSRLKKMIQLAFLN